MPNEAKPDLAPSLPGPDQPGDAPVIGGPAARGFPLAGQAAFERLQGVVKAARELAPRGPETVDLLWNLMRAEVGDAALAGMRSWTPNPYHPMDLLARFAPLRMAPGFRLVSYRYSDGANASSQVWAVPAHHEELASLISDEWPPGLPDGDVAIMKHVQGDGSAWTYLLASIFAREAEELGAEWHGIDWGAHHLVGDPAPQTGRRRRVRDADETVDSLHALLDGHPDWQFAVGEGAPTSWAPVVTEGPDGVRVVFHTYSALGVRTFYRHEDHFTGNGYHFEAQRAVVAHGPGGFVH